MSVEPGLGDAIVVLGQNKTGADQKNIVVVEKLFTTSLSSRV